MAYEANNQQASDFPLPGIMGQPATKIMTLAARIQSNAIKVSLEMQRETFGFLQRRYEKDMKLATELAKKRAPGEILTTYIGFFEDAVDDYSREAAKIGSLGARNAPKPSDIADSLMPEEKPQEQVPAEYV
jgi:hypothetical protein